MNISLILPHVCLSIIKCSSILEQVIFGCGFKSWRNIFTLSCCLSMTKYSSKIVCLTYNHLVIWNQIRMWTLPSSMQMLIQVYINISSIIGQVCPCNSFEKWTFLPHLLMYVYYLSNSVQSLTKFKQSSLDAHSRHDMNIPLTLSYVCLSIIVCSFTIVILIWGHRVIWNPSRMWTLSSSMYIFIK